MKLWLQIQQTTPDWLVRRLPDGVVAGDVPQHNGCLRR